MKILVTRPLHQTAEICNGISQMGHIPILFPTIEIMPPSPTDMSAALATIRTLKDYDFAIFTSANTLLYLSHLDDIHTVKVIAMGPSTEQALNKVGIAVHDVAPAPYTSEALLQLSALQNISDFKIAVVTGAKGRVLLSETLKQRGAHVQTVITYQRQRPLPNEEMLEKIQDIDMITITSEESLQNLMMIPNQYRNLLIKKILIVISQKLATLSKQFGFSKIIIAKNATHAAILTVLQEYRNGKF